MKKQDANAKATRYDSPKNRKEHALVDFIKPKKIPEQIISHVIFVHGLNGDKYKTWRSRGPIPEFWPDWLASDIPQSAVWSLGYPAASSWWKQGAAMALPDRAQSILPALADEPNLQSGNIIFVVHSLGGLVVKQILRLAESRAPYDSNVDAFLNRVRRIIFIGTPHAGSDLASLGNSIKLLTRPRPTQAGLSRNDPHLRDLNAWFRSFADKNKLDALVLYETKQMPLISIPILGVRLLRWQIVKPDSADPGLSPATRVIPLDEDHESIVSPQNRDTQVYGFVRDFIRRPVAFPHPNVRVGQSLGNIELQLDTQAESLTTFRSEVRSNAESLHKTISEFGEVQSGALRELERTVRGQSNQVVSDELKRRLDFVRKSRFFSNFDLETECSRLFNEAHVGDLSTSFADQRRVTFAWCARMTATKNLDEAHKMLAEANRIGPGTENRIAAAIIAAAAKGEDSEVLEILKPLNTPAVRTAAFAAMTLNKNSSEGLAWLEQTNLTIGDFDPDGKLLCLLKRQETGDWSKALDEVQSLEINDMAGTPLLFITAAFVHLAQVTHPELRTAIAQNPPINARDFPLSADQISLEHRRKARELYKTAIAALSEIGQTQLAEVAADYVIWLDLRDPETEKSALDDLRSSLADRQTCLRRLPMALDYNLKVNLAAIELEVDRETALTGGSSFGAAIGRFALAHTKRSPQEVASYIERHHKQLIKYINPETILLLQAEMLARGGDVPAARTKIETLESSALKSDAILRIERLCTEIAGADTISAREHQYEQTKTLSDLYVLVIALKEKEAWDKLYTYGKILFQETKDITHAEFYVHAMYVLGKDKEVIDFIVKNSIIAGQSSQITTFSAWAHYRYGDLIIARSILERLMSNRDVINDRILFVNIMTASGNWDSLVTFVDNEWIRRADRTPKELWTAGQLAHRVGLSSRARDLITEAAEKAKDDAAILVACYSAATAAGWENDPNPFQWFQRAITISGTDGPIKTVNMRELLNMRPDWNDRQSKTSEDLVSAKIPIYLAGVVINQTLLQMFLVNALSNSQQSDVRRRSIIPAFAGNRGIQKNIIRRIALDPTVILTLAFLGVLQETIESFDSVFIPHTTLGWLFQESQQIEYHQPSRLRDALYVKRCIDAGELRRFDRTIDAKPQLESEVGDELANLLTAANLTAPGEMRRKYVVIPYPIRKISTFMDEVADVAAFENSLAGCGDVVRALRSLGQITAAEQAHCEAYLTHQEQPWPHNPEIAPNAVLYLDRVSISYFQHLGLLGKLKAAGFDVLIPVSEIEEGDALVRHAAVHDDAKKIIASIRSILSTGIEAGTVRLAPLIKEIETESEKIELLPSSMLFSAAEHVDGFAVDDRFLNKFIEIDTSFGKKPLLTSIDLLAQRVQLGQASEDTEIEFLTKLRRAGFALVPHSARELSRLINSAKIIDKRLVETAELRGIREASLRVGMTDILQIPEEYAWLQNNHSAFMDTLREIWHQQNDVGEAGARSNWLLSLLDFRSWGHRFAANDGDPLAIRRLQILRLIMLPNLTTDMRTAYWTWLEEVVLEPLQDAEPLLYNDVVKNVGSVIRSIVDRQRLETSNVEV
ncbi:esterase/lipase family protein [Methylobacterium sp. CM6241]